mmetsp:Transcript_56054/g.130551  ORF Transcript_56054/g.130551 Transcript_56054/m.130551 type:complete len:254 (+) Transcript_56054:108-869(+)
MAANWCTLAETLVFLLCTPVAVHGLHGLAGDFSTALDLPLVQDGEAMDVFPLDVANISKELLENISQELGENVTIGNLTKQVKDKPSPKAYSNGEMVVQWDSSDAKEEGSDVRFFWDHGCVGENLTENLTGVCTFQKGDKHNPPGLHVRMSTALDPDARITLTAWIRVMGIVTDRKAECPACGGKCVLKLPLSGDAVMLTPECPLKESFDLIMPDMDFTRIPSFIRGYAVTTVALSRSADEGQSFKSALDTWV